MSIKSLGQTTERRRVRRCQPAGIPALLLAAVLFAAVPPGAGATDNWPQFRGPDTRGVAEGPPLPPDQWSAGPPPQNIAWQADIPGRGWSSPVVWGNRIFLTTAVAEGETEEPKKGLYFGGERPDPPDLVHRWMVLCLDLESGGRLWERTVHEGKPPMPRHIKNSYASETPATDGERVYAYFGNLGLWCLDLDGNVVWTKEMEPRRTRFNWGTAASPVLHEDRLYIVNDNEDESFLLALDKKTGEAVWRVPRAEKSNWSTPYVWVNEQRTEIVTPGTKQVRSYGLDGELLWTLEGMSKITIATPYAVDGLLYVSSGYVGDKNRPLYAIRPGAEGDISLSPGPDGETPTSNASIVWSKPQAAPYNPSTLVYQGRLYVLYDRGRVACFDAKDGAVLYERQRIPGGRQFTSSPWAYGGKVFCLDENGVTFVLKAGGEFEVLHENRLADGDMGMASPAIAGDRLILRTSERVYCIRKGNGG